MKEKENMLDKNNMTLKLEKMTMLQVSENQISRNELLKKKSLQEKGITLIALVVTIIILLILAGVTLNIALSDRGLFSKTKEAADKYKQAQEDEELEIEKIEYAAEGKDITKVETISNEESFKNFRDSVNGGENFENTLVKLSSDLDLSGDTWTPIGTAEHPFKGVFNGNGHKIENLKLVKTEETKENDGFYYIGLFGINEGIIKNIGIKSGSIDSTLDNKCTVGIIAGKSFGKIEECYNKIDITCNDSLYAFGGIVGSIQKSGSVSKCYNEGSLTLGSDDNNCHLAGGIVGNGGNSEGGGIYQCYNLGNIKCYQFSTKESLVGGICGIGRRSLVSCYNMGDITLIDKTVTEHEKAICGGILGADWDESDSFEMQSCYNIGKVELETTESCKQKLKGSLIGCYNNNVNRLKNNFCYIYENLNATGNKETLEGVTSLNNKDEIKNKVVELGADFRETEGNINEGFPILAWQVE